MESKATVIKLIVSQAISDAVPMRACVIFLLISDLCTKIQNMQEVLTSLDQKDWRWGSNHQNKPKLTQITLVKVRFLSSESSRTG